MARPKKTTLISKKSTQDRIEQLPKMENNNSLTEPSSSKPRLKLDFSTASSKINIKKDVQYPLKDDLSRHKEVKTITHARQEYKPSQHAKMRKIDSITHDQESKQSNLDVHIPSSEKKLKDNDSTQYTNQNNNSSRLSDECKLKRNHPDRNNSYLRNEVDMRMKRKVGLYLSFQSLMTLGVKKVIQPLHFEFPIS